MHKKVMRRQKGFTLVEIAIVLVIIGLILGAILKGQELIKNAKVKRIKSDVDAIVAAVYSYQDKYNGYLPGDNPRGTGSGICNCGAAGGACGDGLWSNTTEYVCAWRELIGGNFISGNPRLTDESTVAKRHPFGGRYLFRYGTHNGKNGNYIYIDNVPYDVARTLDEKYDDGIWNSGDIQASGDYSTAGNRDMYWYAF